MNKERLKAIITIIVTAIVNIANIYGYSIDAAPLINATLSVLSAITIAYSWWKNQNITTAAQSAQKYLCELKRGNHNVG